jgi:hypothetical protein
MLSTVKFPPAAELSARRKTFSSRPENRFGSIVRRMSSTARPRSKAVLQVAAHPKLRHRLRLGAVRLTGRLETAGRFNPGPKLWGSICNGGDNCAKSDVVAPGSIRLMAWRKRRTHRAAISAWRTRCSATGRSSSSSPGRSSATSSCFGPCPNFRPSWSSFPRSVGCSCSIRPGWGCRTRSRKFARSMIARPRSRPSWTPSASEEPPFSV